MVDWTLKRDGTEEDNLYDVRTQDSANPFGDTATFKIDDVDGTKFDEYNFGTQVTAEVSPETSNDLNINSGDTFTVSSGSVEDVAGTVTNAGTFENSGTVENQVGETFTDFEGFVVKSDTIDQNGADVLKVTAYTFDQFLRRNDVTNDQSEKNIDTALKDIIQTDTPVNYNSNKVTVVDNQTNSQSLKDERVETALQTLAFRSADEAFGVDADLDFFFRPREETHIDRGIDNTEWFNYNIPERGEEAINEVEVRYNDGSDKIVVDNGDQKLNLQDSLGLPDPGVQRERINRPNITNIEPAEEAGRRFLELKNNTLTGTITTFGLFEASPFDTIDISIPDRGIDTEFIITKVVKDWGRDETQLTIVENKGFEDDLIVRLSEKTERVDLRGSDPDANQNRITSTNIRVDLESSAVFDGTNADQTLVTNEGKNSTREGWRDNGFIQINDIAVGTDGSGLSRSNVDLRNEVTRKSVTETLPNSKSVKYEATFTETNIEEVGLFDNNGDLISRAVIESTDIDGTVSIEITVSNDPAVERGVITDDGQTAIRDIIANEIPALPQKYAYGDDDTAVSTSDTSLGNQVASNDLDRGQIDTIDTSSEWTDYLKNGIADDKPLRVINGELEATQTAFTRDIFLTDNTGGDTTNIVFDGSTTGAAETNSIYFDTTDTSTFVEYNFTTYHKIPQENLVLYERSRYPTIDDPQDIRYELNGTRLTEFGGSKTTDFEWVTYDDTNQNWAFNQDLPAGDHTLRIQLETAGTDEARIDLALIADDRFGQTLDNQTGAGDSLDGPEKFPDSVFIEFKGVDTDRQFTGGELTSTWRDNNTDNNQFVEISNDGSNFTRQNNDTDVSATFNQSSNTFFANAQLSRYTSDNTTTPKDGDSGQAIDLVELFVDFISIRPEGIGEANTRAFFDGSTLSGNTLKEAGHLDSNDNALTRSIFADIDVDNTFANVISSETVLFQNK